MSAIPHSREGPPFVTIPRLDRIPWLIHGFGTRSWTLADFRARRDWGGMRVIWANQIHSDTIAFVARPFKIRLRADALATDRPGILLAVKTADCLPVFLIDEKRRAIAAVHSGWRGTEQTIVERAVPALAGRFGSDPGGLLAALGPCIGAACYEVGDEVRERFREAGVPARVFRRRPGRPGKFLLDLRAANRIQLERQGVKRDHIFDTAICTHCDDRFHSYRRDRDTTARLWNFIGIRVRGML